MVTSRPPRRLSFAGLEVDSACDVRTFLSEHRYCWYGPDAASRQANLRPEPRNHARRIAAKYQASGSGCSTPSGRRQALPGTVEVGRETGSDSPAGCVRLPVWPRCGVFGGHQHSVEAGAGWNALGIRGPGISKASCVEADRPLLDHVCEPLGVSGRTPERSFVRRDALPRRCPRSQLKLQPAWYPRDLHEADTSSRSCRPRSRPSFRLNAELGENSCRFSASRCGGASRKVDRTLGRVD